jgi:hypothetical protein
MQSHKKMPRYTYHVEHFTHFWVIIVISPPTAIRILTTILCFLIPLFILPSAHRTTLSSPVVLTLRIHNGYAKAQLDHLPPYPHQGRCLRHVSPRILLVCIANILIVWCVVLRRTLMISSSLSLFEHLSQRARRVVSRTQPLTTLYMPC